MHLDGHGPWIPRLPHSLYPDDGVCLLFVVERKRERTCELASFGEVGKGGAGRQGCGVG